MQNTEENKKKQNPENVENHQNQDSEDTASQTGKGDGYVPPTPEIPSAQNARQHTTPITSKNPRGRQQ